MTRTPAQIVAQMATAAALTPFDDKGNTWADALFTGDQLSLPEEPDRALLAGVAEEFARLDEHVDTLPTRAHLDWLERILDIDRLPVVPDRVIAHATVDPKLAPAVVAKGTLLRGGKDAFGQERRYATTDALTAHGAAVVGVKSLVPGGSTAQAHGIASSAPDFPLTPATGPDAPHTMRIHSPVLGFSGGTMGVRLTFTGSGSAASLTGVMWRYPLPDGTTSPLVTGAVSGTSVAVTLSTGCGFKDAMPWIEAVVPPTVAVPLALSFQSVTVAVESRSAIVPEAAYMNDGAVDITKECQPFGVTAKQGDSLYLRCDEAFSKPLGQLTLSITKMPVASPSNYNDNLYSELAGNLQYMMYSDAYNVHGVGAYEAEEGEIQDLIVSTATAGTTKLVWQRRVGGGWQEIVSSGTQLNGFTNVAVNGIPGSEPMVIGGQEGRYIRAFLQVGDFGWSAYQGALAAFATAAVDDGSPTMPVPPVPRTVTSVALTYTTTAVAALKVESFNGWARTVKPTGSTTWTPFRKTVSPAGDTGMLALGMVLPDSAIGSSVSVYLDVDSASPCGSSQDPDAGWQWWNGTAWVPLVVADGTHLLRESGLLRFVAPVGWAVGCTDTDASDGRWVRMVTEAPDRMGIVRSVTPDAVIADFVSNAADPQTDPSPDTALPSGTIKGTLSPIVGVKKVTNLSSVRGRGPETDASYLRRASAIARDRNRALAGWDYEEHVSVAFPEVAAVRCLPHTNSSGVRALGKVGLVVVPARLDDPAPRPSVSLSGRITDALEPLMPMHASAAVMCALYAKVTVQAQVRLRPDIAALTGKDAITQALETWLHPTGTTPTRWGRSLYRSSLEAFLEHIPVVDSVLTVAMLNDLGASVDVITVDACRGLYCSSGAHLIGVEEQL